MSYYANLEQTSPIVWVDMEMTGLDLAKEQIMEIAVIVTDANLNTIASLSSSIIIKVEDGILDTMNDWCREHHGASGLTAACKASKISLAEAEQTCLNLVKSVVPKARVAPLAGNSIHMDRMFLQKYMPEFLNYLHYRIIDVSSIKELARRWYPKEFATVPAKKGAHTALSDILESIEELRYYRQAIFKQQEVVQQQQ